MRGSTVKEYLIITERAKDGTLAAYVPDLPGCVVAGQSSLRGLLSAMKTAIEMHIQGMIEDGEEVPEPASKSEYLKVGC